MAAWDTAEGLCPPSRCHQAMPPPFVGSHAPPAHTHRAILGTPSPRWELSGHAAVRGLGAAGRAQGAAGSGVQLNRFPWQRRSAGRGGCSSPEMLTKGRGKGARLQHRNPPAPGKEHVDTRPLTLTPRGVPMAEIPAQKSAGLHPSQAKPCAVVASPPHSLSWEVPRLPPALLVPLILHSAPYLKWINL